MKIKRILYIVPLFFFLSSCIFFQNCIAPEGEIVSKQIDLGPIHSIDLKSNVKLIISQSMQQELEIRAPQNYIDILNKEVSEGEWNIQFDRCLKESELVEIYLSVEMLKELSISGSGDIYGEGLFSGEELELKINGSGSIQLESEYKEIELVIAGSGDIQLKGEAKELGVEINGSGDVNTEELVSDNCEIRINGSGDVRVNSTNSLQVKINGSGDVFYKGDPRDIDSKINGSGDLTQIQ